MAAFQLLLFLAVPTRTSARDADRSGDATAV
jgi:hypothetical protein